MRRHGFFAALLLAGCAQGESIYDWGGPIEGFEPEGDSGYGEGLPAPEGFAWSVAVDDGAAHRLLADDGATVLAASRARVTVSRFEADGSRTWSSEVSQVAGGAPVEIGRARRVSRTTRARSEKLRLRQAPRGVSPRAWRCR